MTRIAVFVSGGGTNLAALIDAEKKGSLQNGRLSLVVSSNPEAYALERAWKHGVPTAVVARKAYDSQDEYDGALLRLLKHHEISLVVLAGFMSILSKNFIKEYKNKIVNVHPSLIPSFCGKGFYGLKVHEAALERGVKLTGATVHFVNEIPDGGPIILQKGVEVRSEDMPETLQRRVMEEAEWTLLPQAVSLFCEGRLKVDGQRVTIKEAEESK